MGRARGGAWNPVDGQRRPGDLTRSGWREPPTRARDARAAVKSREVIELGRELLWQAWQDAAGGSAAELPEGVELRIAQVMRPDTQVSQRYALLTQLLLKLAIEAADSRQLTGF